jgi:L-alanine-DL-glutamate epimerase-like enolase superfamily enzyme
VLQPDIGRVGGFTEARKVGQIAAERGLLLSLPKLAPVIRQS